jgi:hypothetical protein
MLPLLPPRTPLRVTIVRHAPSPANEATPEQTSKKQAASAGCGERGCGVRCRWVCPGRGAAWPVELKVKNYAAETAEAASPHSADGTHDFAAEHWTFMPFSEEAIARDPALSSPTLSAADMQAQ